MTTPELEQDPSKATTKLRVTPEGDLRVTSSETGGTAYGPVEIAWYPDRLEITAVAAGRALITKGYLRRRGDVIVEIRPPGLEALTETVPGAD